MFDNFRDIMNFDEELFENRNKDYGAYQLRKRYNSVMMASVVFAILIFAFSVVLPFLLRPRNEKVLAGGYGYTSVEMQRFEPPEEIYVSPVLPPAPPAKTEEVLKYIPPEVVDTIVPMELSIPTSDELSDILPESDSDITGAGTGNNPMGVEGGIATDDPFFFVEQLPTFRGGDINKFRLWVQQRTFYPQEAIDKKIRGTVFLTFIVETDGSVSNVNIIQGVDPLIDVEAKKAIESSPKWSPGLQRGQPVRFRYAIKLNFTF